MPERRPLPIPLYQFDPRFGSTGRYINAATGKIVPRDAVNAAMEARIEAGKAQVEKLSRSLINGDISLAQWQVSMRDEVKLLHTMAGATSKGGWDRMSPADWGRVGSASKGQYRKLQDFAQDIASGKENLLNAQGLPNGRLLQRSRMYADAAYGTMDEMNRAGAGEKGITEERRIREAENSCQTCIDEENRGWVKLGESKAIGDSECRTNCRCRREYRNAAGEVFE